MSVLMRAPIDESEAERPRPRYLDGVLADFASTLATAPADAVGDTVTEILRRVSARLELDWAILLTQDGGGSQPVVLHHACGERHLAPSSLQHLLESRSVASITQSGPPGLVFAVRRLRCGCGNRSVAVPGPISGARSDDAGGLAEHAADARRRFVDAGVSLDNGNDEQLRVSPPSSARRSYARPTTRPCGVPSLRSGLAPHTERRVRWRAARVPGSAILANTGVGESSRSRGAGQASSRWPRRRPPCSSSVKPASGRSVSPARFTN